MAPRKYKTKKAKLEAIRRHAVEWYHRNKERTKQKREERASKGLCKRCGKSAAENRFYCQIHLSLGNKSRKKSWGKRTKVKSSMRLELIKLKGGKCIDCGYNKHHAALDFDHVVGQKRYNISNMLNSVMAWKTILEEVAKCELVCSNCHRIRTFNRRQKK